MPTANSRNAPLAIMIPAVLSKRLAEEAKKRGIKKSTLLMNAAISAVVEPPTVNPPEDSVQVSFRIPKHIRQKLSLIARERETSIAQLIQESLKRSIPDTPPW